jgi:transaldolase
MRLFLDTAIVSDVEERLPTGLISGITTNPTLIKKSGRDPEDVYREMFNLGVMDLSIEVPGTDCTEFIANGFQAVRDWGSYATVKLPCTVEGLKACKYLEERNVRCNMTLVFSVSQAVLCGIAGATYVSPFVGRLDDNGLNGLKLITDICTVYCRQNIATKVLAASIRDAQSAAKAFSHGAYICTLPPKVFDNMSTHVLTDKGLEQFNRDFLA